MKNNLQAKCMMNEYRCQANIYSWRIIEMLCRLKICDENWRRKKQILNMIKQIWNLFWLFCAEI